VTTTGATSGAERNHDLSRRAVTGTLMAAVVFASVTTVPTFTVVVLAITLGSLWELGRLSARNGQTLIFPVAALAVACYIVLAALGLQHRYEKAMLAGTLLASLAVALAGSRQGFLARSAFTLFGVIYIGWLSSYFLALRNLPQVGAAYTIAAIVLVALTDIFAMFVGVAIGRTPLSPISPRKTWEGAIGGFLASSAGGASLALLPQIGIPWWQGLFVGAVTSVAAQVGDLIESALKRDAQVKDAGTVLGGHGGILDRFDSYLLGGIAFYGAMFVTGHIAPLR
jgi:phosphatidate cytidylyltransferase